MRDIDNTSWAVAAGKEPRETSDEQAVARVVAHLAKHPEVSACSECGVVEMSSSTSVSFGHTIIVRGADLPL